MWVYAACYRGYNVGILSGLTKSIGNDEPYVDAPGTYGNTKWTY